MHQSFCTGLLILLTFKELVVTTKSRIFKIFVFSYLYFPTLLLSFLKNTVVLVCLKFNSLVLSISTLGGHLVNKNAFELFDI